MNCASGGTQQAAGMNAGGVPILTSGLKFQPISVSATRMRKSSSS